MKLTEEQRKQVEDNHNLIYWYINTHGLDIAEWYDLLAIELCNAVMKHDPEKSGLSTYFKLRADGLVYKEYKKSQSQKRANTSVPYIENIHQIAVEDDMAEVLEIKEWMGVENQDILRLKMEGYTQAEIAKMLGVSQSYISKILKKMRKRYNELNR